MEKHREPREPRWDLIITVAIFLFAQAFSAGIVVQKVNDLSDRVAQLAVDVHELSTMKAQK